MTAPTQLVLADRDGDQWVVMPDGRLAPVSGVLSWVLDGSLPRAYVERLSGPLAEVAP